MLVEQPLHRRAVIEKFFDNSEHFVPVLKVSGEQADVEDNVNQRDACVGLVIWELLAQVLVNLIGFLRRDLGLHV